MALEREHLVELATAISDGDPVDWDTIESSARTDQDRIRTWSEFDINTRNFHGRGNVEDGGIEREPAERCAEQQPAHQPQTTVRHTTEEPDEREAFNRPAERDPFPLVLEREDQTNEKQ